MRHKAAYASVLALGLLLGLTGIRWGLPNEARLERLLPEGLHGAEFHRELESSWKALHARLGLNIMLSPDAFGTFAGVRDLESGWSTPPDLLLNAIRSFHVRSVHDDEQTVFIALSKMRPQRLELNPHFFIYGGSYLYPMGAWLGIGAALGIVPLHTSMTPYLDSPPAMAAMYFWGRLLSVAAYIGCALLLLEMGVMILGERTGHMAAVLFLLSPGALIQAHTMKPHIYWSFFSLLTLLLCLKIRREGTLKNYTLAGLVSGFAVGAAFNAWPSCLFIAATALLRIAETPKRWSVEVKYLAAAGAASLGTFILTNPYWVLDFGRASAEFLSLGGWTTLNPLQPVLLLTHAFRQAVTIPFLILCLAGLYWSLTGGRKNKELAVCAAAFILMGGGSFMIGGVTGTRQIRYFIPMVGIGMLLAAVCVSELGRRHPHWRKAGAAVFVAAGLNLATHSTLYAWNFHLTETERSNHYLAGDWMRDNIPHGAVVGIVREPAPSNTAYFPLHRFRLRLIQPDLFGTLPPERLPEFFVVTSPDYDERPMMEPNLSGAYRRAAVFPRARLAWAVVNPTATTANPLIEIYRKLDAGAKK